MRPSLRCHPIVVSLLVGLGLVAAVPASAVPSLTYLPLSTADLTSTRVTRLSPDGTVIVGVEALDFFTDFIDEGVRWTAASGWARSPSAGGANSFFGSSFVQQGFSNQNDLLVSLRGPGYADTLVAPQAQKTPITQIPYADASCTSVSGAAISADGTTVVGGIAGVPSCQGAFRWTAATGTVLIGPPGTAATGLATSADGSVVAGSVGQSLGSLFVWTQAAGYTPLSITLAAGTGSGPVRVSADGSTIAGTATTANGVEGFVWNAVSGATFLGDLPGGLFRSEVAAVSADGTRVAGTGRSAAGAESFVWTASDGFTALGIRSVTTAMTPDGRYAVGNYDGPGSDSVFVWDLSSGVVRSLESILRDAGIAVPAGGLGSPIGISDDGRTIAGRRVGPEGPWVAVIPEPDTFLLLFTGLASLRVVASRRRAPAGGSSAP